MAHRRQGDMPSYLRLPERVKSTAIYLAAEHFAASSFLGNAEILLHQGDTDSQWSEMYKEMMEDTYIPAVERAELWQQREKLKSYIGISVTEIKNIARRSQPDIPVEAQLVELPPSRGRGRPPLDPEVKAERARLAAIERLTSPTRGRGRPPLTDEERADRAMGITKDPNAPARPRGRPPGSRNVKTSKGVRMVRVIPPIESVETGAQREAAKEFFEEYGMTEEDYRALHEIGQPREHGQSIPEKPVREYQKVRPYEEFDILDLTAAVPNVFDDEEEDDEDSRLYQ